jgi:hypothetical protein
MATPAQIKANQSNAQHSSGPRTAEGKARSAANGMRHGFCSQTVLLPGDDPAEYQALLEELRDHFPCIDLNDDRFVREMTNAEWRLRRVRRHQEVLLTDACEQIAAADPSLDPDRVQARAYDQLLAKSGSLAVLMRYETKFERQYDRAYHGWFTYQNEKRRNEMRMFFPSPSKKELAAMLQPEVQEPLSSADKDLPSEPNSAPKIARNAPCPCGSGRKYKRCCGRGTPPTLSTRSLSV